MNESGGWIIIVKCVFALAFIGFGIHAFSKEKANTEAGKLVGSEAKIVGIFTFLIGFLYLMSQILKFFGIDFLDEFVRATGIMQPGNS